MKIGYIGGLNPKDRSVASGLPFAVCRAFESMGHEVVWISPSLSLGYRIRRKIVSVVRKICGCQNPKYQPLSDSSEYAKRVDRGLLAQMDLFLSVNSSVVVASMDLPRPLIYRTDATFNNMVDYYYFGLSQQNIRDGNTLEQMILDRSSVVLYPSQWAWESAVSFYNQPTSKLYVVESGANIDPQDIVCREPILDSLNICFIGVDWVRKGGDVAVEACGYLYDMGRRVTLTIVGIKDLDESILSLPYIRNIGFLDKNDPLQYSTLIDIIQESHLLLLPTLAECAGVVFCECSGYGVPSFTYDTGGVANYVINGENGYRLPLGSRGVEFGRKIDECLKQGELPILSKRAVELYKTRFNWAVWRDRVERIVVDFLD